MADTTPPQAAADASPGPAEAAPIDQPTPVTAGSATATAGATVFSGLTAPSGNMPANAPAVANVSVFVLAASVIPTEMLVVGVNVYDLRFCC